MTVISTVGYGSYSVQTQAEIKLVLMLEFVGMLVFGLMIYAMDKAFSINFNWNNMNDESIIWIKKLEKSNKPLFINALMYSEITDNLEASFLGDHNSIIEDHEFYFRL